MLFARLLTMALAALWLSGCVTYSEQPLSPPEGATLDKALIGAWRSIPDTERVYLHIGAADEHRIEVVSMETTDEGHLKQDRYIAHTSALDNGTFLNVVETTTEGTPRGFIFVKYAVVGGKELRIALIEEETVKAAVKSSAIAGRVEDTTVSPDVTLTATPDRLRKFVAEQGAALFPRMMSFRRLD